MTAPDAPYRFIQEDNVSILILKQELNNVQWGEIDSIGTQVLNSLAERPHPHIIVDLSQLNYMGSAMVALIVRVWKATLARKGKLAVVCPHEGVREVLQLASLDKHWAITDTQTEARKAVGAGRGAHRPHVDDASDKTAWKVAAVLSTTLLLAIIIGGLIYAFGTSGGPDPSITEDAIEVEDAELGEEAELEETVIEEATDAPEFTAPPVEDGDVETDTPETTAPEVMPAENPASSDEPPALPPLENNAGNSETLTPGDAPAEGASEQTPAETDEPAAAAPNE